MALDFSQFECLSFDCYGTLIDWESGILAALRPVLAAHGRNLMDEGLLELYAALEAEEEAGPYRPYREVLQYVTSKLGARLVFTPTLEELDALPRSLPNWPPFVDTVAAVRRLRSRYKLAVISNTDDDLFAGTARRLGVSFDYVITAQQCRSYKPSPNNFETALARIGLPRLKVLHIAQSIYHDIIPAGELGISTVWINRRHNKKGSGATVAALAEPDLELPDLASLAELAIGRA